jgi:hypothetical protein
MSDFSELLATAKARSDAGWRTMDGMSIKILMEILAENESLRAALKDAEYRADQGKVWNGMGWTYTGLSAHGQQKVLDILHAAISSPENP